MPGRMPRCVTYPCHYYPYMEQAVQLSRPAVAAPATFAAYAAGQQHTRRRGLARALTLKATLLCTHTFDVILLARPSCIACTAL